MSIDLQPAAAARWAMKWVKRGHPVLCASPSSHDGNVTVAMQCPGKAPQTLVAHGDQLRAALDDLAWRLCAEGWPAPALVSLGTARDGVGVVARCHPPRNARRIAVDLRRVLGALWPRA